MRTQYTGNNVETVRKEQYGPDGVLEKARTRKFIRMFVQDYKRTRQSRRRVVSIQSAMCEVASEGNGRGLKIAVVKMYRTVNSVYENRSVKKYSEQINCLIIKFEQWHIGWCAQ